MLFSQVLHLLESYLFRTDKRVFHRLQVQVQHHVLISISAVHI